MEGGIEGILILSPVPRPLVSQNSFDRYKPLLFEPAENPGHARLPADQRDEIEALASTNSFPQRPFVCVFRLPARFLRGHPAPGLADQARRKNGLDNLADGRHIELRHSPSQPEKLGRENGKLVQDGFDRLDVERTRRSGEFHYVSRHSSVSERSENAVANFHGTGGFRGVVCERLIERKGEYDFDQAGHGDSFYCGWDARGKD